MSASLILLILGIAEPILAASGVIPTQWQPLAAGILNAITAVKSELTTSTGRVSVNAASLIAGINAGIQQLAAAGALGASSGIATALASAVNAGENALSGTTSVDPSKLQRIS